MCAIAPQNRNKAQPALGFPPSEILDWTMESEEREHGEGSGSSSRPHPELSGKGERQATPCLSRSEWKGRGLGLFPQCCWQRYLTKCRGRPGGCWARGSSRERSSTSGPWVQRETRSQFCGTSECTESLIRAVKSRMKVDLRAVSTD